MFFLGIAIHIKQSESVVSTILKICLVHYTWVSIIVVAISNQGNSHVDKVSGLCNIFTLYEQECTLKLVLTHPSHVTEKHKSNTCMESKYSYQMQTTLMSLFNYLNINEMSSSSFKRQASFLTPYRCLTLCFSVTCDAAKYWFECNFLWSQRGNRLVVDMCLVKSIEVIFGANIRI